MIEGGIPPPMVVACVVAPVYTHRADRTQEAEDSNKGSMATAHKQSLRTGMGRASAGRCRAGAHDGQAQAWRTHAMHLYALAKGFVDVDCVDVDAAGNLRA
mmetsp:Transcript_45810/g.67165  ORF Transcript_45810/g.67165 Transcript_45810/m.67165 type:complete len:101 (-) Transcript_45810:481-783(-)